MSLNDLEATNQAKQRIKLVQSMEEIVNSQNLTSKKSAKPTLLSSSLSLSAPKLLKDLKTQLKSLKIYQTKPKNGDMLKNLREKALQVIDQNNQLNSVIEGDIALKYLETQDISPKHDNKNLLNSKKEMIKANVELNKILFKRFFLDDYPENLDPNIALDKLAQELKKLKSNSFDKENLNYYKTSHSFIEIQSAHFLEQNPENACFDKLKDDYSTQNEENLKLKQENQELKYKLESLQEEDNGLKKANSILINELEMLDKELKNSKDSLLLKSNEFEKEKNEEFKLLDEKITKLLEENDFLRQKNSQQEKILLAMMKENKESTVISSTNLNREKSNQFSQDFKKINFDKENISKILKESDHDHGKCLKIIEDLKNELMEAHLCIADLENKIKQFWFKKGKSNNLVIKNYDVSLNLADDKGK